VSARIGRSFFLTGHGLAANIRLHYPKSLLYAVVSLLLVANTINIAADLGAMAAALQLLVGGSTRLYIVAFALVSLGLQVFIPSPVRAVPQVADARALALRRHGVRGAGAVARGRLAHARPGRDAARGYLFTLVAVSARTISPYLFFWQASQEVEEQRAAAGEEPLLDAPVQAAAAASPHQDRITYVG